MRKKVKITTELEETYCDICGKETGGYVPQIVSLYNTKFSCEYSEKNKAFGSTEFNTEFKLNPKKDICIHCINNALNKALEDLYKAKAKND